MSTLQLSLESLERDVAYFMNQASYEHEGAVSAQQPAGRPARRLAMESAEEGSKQKGLLETIGEKIAAMFKWLQEAVDRLAGWFKGFFSKNVVKDAPKTIPELKKDEFNLPEVPADSDPRILKLRDLVANVFRAVDGLQKHIDDDVGLYPTMYFRIPDQEVREIQGKYNAYADWVIKASDDAIKAITSRGTEAEIAVQVRALLEAFKEANVNILGVKPDYLNSALSIFEHKITTKYRSVKTTRSTICEGYENVVDVLDSPAFREIQNVMSKLESNMKAFESHLSRMIKHHGNTYSDGDEFRDRVALIKAMNELAVVFRCGTQLAASLARGATFVNNVAKMGIRIGETLQAMRVAFEELEAVKDLSPENSKALMKLVRGTEALMN